MMKFLTLIAMALSVTLMAQGVVLGGAIGALYQLGGNLISVYFLVVTIVIWDNPIRYPWHRVR